MNLIFLLSGENVEMAKWEAIRLAESYGETASSELDGRLLVIEYRGESFFERLALSHEVSRLLLSCDFGELENAFAEIEIPAAPCCVRVRAFVDVDRMKLERQLGSVLWRRGAKISVSSPSKIFRVYITPKRCYVCELLHVVDKKQFLERRPDKRPFFMPSVVLPKFARALVNLSGARRNLLDPMCGTGSILIEAGLMNIYAVGMDIYRKIAAGCAENLRFYGVEADVLVGDARNMPISDESVEAIVTDYPYLRSTKTEGELEDLYERSADEFARVLDKRGFAVVVSNIDAEGFFRDFRIVAKFEQRVHSSLTRRVLLLSR